MNTTMQPFRARKLSTGQIVQIYRNLKNGKWSIRDKRTHLVVAHADELVLHNAAFISNQAGQQRVKETGVKNVHAYIEGSYNNLDFLPIIHDRKVHYNPFQSHLFFDQHGEIIKNAKSVIFGKEGLVYATGIQMVDEESRDEKRDNQ